MVKKLTVEEFDILKHDYDINDFTGGWGGPRKDAIIYIVADEIWFISSEETEAIEAMQKRNVTEALLYDAIRKGPQ